jgi:hypothetical protein
VGRFDVRRLAAVDMYGGSGRPWRRRVILVEFLAGAVLCPALGIVSLAWAGGAFGWLLGVWLIGIGLNYVPLALHALSLSRPGALEAEVAGLDVRRELRFYTRAQLWMFVPGLVAVLALLQLRRRPRAE